MKVVLEDSIKNNKPFSEQAKIIKQIIEVEYLIQQRKEFLMRQ